VEEGRPGKVGRLGSAVTLFAVAAGFLYLYLVEPSTSPFAVPCLFTALAGVHCPGCGSLRALHALALGDLKAALALNAPLVIALPVNALLLLLPFLRRSSSLSS
jgi:hypothetical protein